MKPCFYFFDSSFVYLGESTDTEFHCHHALQITISTEKPFLLETKEEKKFCYAALTKKNVLHKLDSKDGWQIIILIDPDHEKAALINRIFPDDITRINPDIIINEIPQVTETIIKSGDCTEVRKKIEMLLEKITGSPGAGFKYEKDKRITQIEEYIENLDEIKVSIKTLTDLVSLSESRLSHLFKEQTGIPIRKFVLWKRLISGFKCIAGGLSITDAAHEAGFSDSAHFTRTFKTMFGVAPFKYVKKFKDSSFVQLLKC